MTEAKLRRTLVWLAALMRDGFARLKDLVCGVLPVQEPLSINSESWVAMFSVGAVYDRPFFAGMRGHRPRLQIASASRYISSRPRSDGDAASPPGTALMVSVLGSGCG